MSRKSISETQRNRIWLKHGGVCHICGQKIDGGRERWDIDHIIPLALGGEDDFDNMAPAHVSCHREKTKQDVKHIAKAKRQQNRSKGIKKTVKRKIPGSIGSGIRKRMNGDVIRVKE